MPYLSASAVVIHYEEALYQVYPPLHLPVHWQKKAAASLLISHARAESDKQTNGVNKAVPPHSSILA